jgi:hypothetical protein
MITLREKTILDRHPAGFAYSIGPAIDLQDLADNFKAQPKRIPKAKP